MTELDQLLAEAEPLRISDPDEKLGAIVDRINAIRNGASMAPVAIVEGSDAVLPPTVTVDDEDAVKSIREGLIAQAEAKGIKVDKRWSNARLLEVLQ